MIEKIKEVEHQVKELGSFFVFNREALAKNIVDDLEMMYTEISELRKRLLTEKANTNKANQKIVKMESQVESIKCKMNDLDIKYNLISIILSAREETNEYFEDFKKRIEIDFMKFANQEQSIPNEAEMILKLYEITKKIQETLVFSSIYNKNIVAIGGGFSAGKSEFVSSFFNNSNIKLPIGIKPATAIPTYITNGGTDAIYGFTSKGGRVKIDSKIYEKLSHDFVKAFKFNLKDIMPAMTIETSIKYSNLAFVDTPGYNPATTNDSYTSEDIKTSKEYLDNANALIWMIGLDANGTIPSTDLDFIKKLNLQSKPIYFIANKADLKPNDEIESILDEFEDKLEDEGINYIGISAYSSILIDELSYRKLSLYQFLDDQNKEVNLSSDIVESLINIFDTYENAIMEDIRKNKEYFSKIHSLELDLLEVSDIESDNNVLFDKIRDLKSIFETIELKKQLKTIDSIKERVIVDMGKIFRENFKASKKFQKKRKNSIHIEEQNNYTNQNESYSTSKVDNIDTIQSKSRRKKNKNIGKSFKRANNGKSIYILTDSGLIKKGTKKPIVKFKKSLELIGRGVFVEIVDNDTTKNHYE